MQSWINKNKWWLISYILYIFLIVVFIKDNYLAVIEFLASHEEYVYKEMQDDVNIILLYPVVIGVIVIYLQIRKKLS